MAEIVRHSSIIVNCILSDKIYTRRAATLLSVPLQRGSEGGGVLLDLSEYRAWLQPSCEAGYGESSVAGRFRVQANSMIRVKNVLVRRSAGRVANGRPMHQLRLPAPRSGTMYHSHFPLRDGQLKGVIGHLERGIVEQVAGTLDWPGRAKGYPRFTRFHVHGKDELAPVV